VVEFGTGTLDPTLSSALLQAVVFLLIGVAATTILLRRRDLM
jgi:hypothetical protein